MADEIHTISVRASSRDIQFPGAKIDLNIIDIT